MFCEQLTKFLSVQTGLLIRINQFSLFSDNLNFSKKAHLYLSNNYSCRSYGFKLNIFYYNPLSRSLLRISSIFK